MELTIRISGAQGEGIETTGRMLATVFAKLGYHVFAFRQYASIIKGNPTMFYQIRVSDRRIYSHGRWKNFDVLIALNDVALSAYRSGARYVISEKEIPLTEIATRHGNRIMRNVAAIGALAALIGLDTKYIAEQIKREFGERREDRRGQHSGFGGGV
jgi:2-oxoglutarate ferredoxin oxidoreductase subunit alpha